VARHARPDARQGRAVRALFHPEAYDVLAEALDGLGLAARARRPAVWLTQLRDVARWWRERSGFRAHFAEQDGRLSIELECTPRAVVLARGWRWPGRQRAWDGEWRILDDRVLHIDDGTRPLIGVAGVDARTVAFLVEQGYIVDDGERSAQCALTLTDTVVGSSAPKDDSSSTSSAQTRLCCGSRRGPARPRAPSASPATSTP
jgi:hypothetical protein